MVAKVALKVFTFAACVEMASSAGLLVYRAVGSPQGVEGWVAFAAIFVGSVLAGLAPVAEWSNAEERAAAGEYARGLR